MPLIATITFPIDTTGFESDAAAKKYYEESEADLLELIAFLPVTITIEHTDAHNPA